jgi:hypothetical protein
MRRLQPLLIGLVALATLAPPAEAWMRARFEDAEVVARSPLIVVGHLRRGTLERVEHPDKGYGHSREHHATLIVSEFLKGRVEKREIPIVIHYGLDPVLGREASPWHEAASPNEIPLFDSGNSAVSFEPVIDDVGQDLLWFLRRLSGTYGEDEGSGPYGIRDPEDVRPLAWKRYVLAYLSKDPEAALRKFVRRHPDQAHRAQSTLEHFEIQRLHQIADPEARAEKLLPYYLRQAGWHEGNEAREALLTAGKSAGRRLVEVFDDPRVESRRWEILQAWRDLGYREVAPLLIQLLLQRDRYWASQHLKKGWWNDMSAPETASRRNAYMDVYGAVAALRSFHDPAAREVLELTRGRWQALAFDNPQIVEECDRALHELETEERTGSRD